MDLSKTNRDGTRRSEVHVTVVGIDTICFFFSILCFSLCCFFAQIMLKNMLFALHYAKLF